MATPLPKTKKKSMGKVSKSIFLIKNGMKKTFHRSVCILVSYMRYFLQFFSGNTFAETFKFILISKLIKKLEKEG